MIIFFNLHLPFDKIKNYYVPSISHVVLKMCISLVSSDGTCGGSTYDILSGRL